MITSWHLGCMTTIEWSDEWTVVSNDRGVWVKHVPTGKGWQLAPASALEVKDDKLARTYQRLHGSNKDT